jgi:hypothetical protein
MMVRIAYILVLLVVGCFVACCYSSAVLAQGLLQGNDAARLCVDKWRKNLDSLRLVRFSGSFVDWIEYENEVRTEDNQLCMNWIIDFTNKRFWSGVINQNNIADSEKYVSESSFVDGKILVVSKYSLKNQDDQEDHDDQDDWTEFGIVSNVNANDEIWNTTPVLLYWSYAFGYVESGGARLFLPNVLDSARLDILDESGIPILRGITTDFVITIEFNSEECQYVKYLEIKRNTQLKKCVIYKTISIVEKYSHLLKIPDT